MIPVLSNAQVREVEMRTILKRGITGLDLMEEAGVRCATLIQEMERTGEFGHVDRYTVLAGMGNNGGDGLVVARHLRNGGRPVRVVLVEHRAISSPERTIQLERVERTMGDISVLDRLVGSFGFIENEVVIDALLGAGATRPVTGMLADLVDLVNTSGCRVVAIDLPTGMPETDAPEVIGSLLRADHTLTFEVPRPSFFFPGSGDQLGQWRIVPIGLDQQALHQQDKLGDWVERSDVIGLLKDRPRSGHKGSFGHALVIAGSEGFHGAGVLCAQGCARSGVGLLTVQSAIDTLHALGVVLPDAMTLGSATFPDTLRFSAIGIGPGIGLGDAAFRSLEQVTGLENKALVFDADAITMLASRPDLLDRIPMDSVLTPHPKEMDRLLAAQPTGPYHRLLLTKAFAVEHRCFLILKGACTAICTPHGRIYFNSTGNVGMAKGGSGDVLTGLLTGLLAQGYSPLDACLIGVHLHGLAGDLAANALGIDAMRASDLVQYLPAAWKQLRGR